MPSYISWGMYLKVTFIKICPSINSPLLFCQSPMPLALIKYHSFTMFYALKGNGKFLTMALRSNGQAHLRQTEGRMSVVWRQVQPIVMQEPCAASWPLLGPVSRPLLRPQTNGCVRVSGPVRAYATRRRVVSVASRLPVRPTPETASPRRRGGQPCPSAYCEEDIEVGKALAQPIPPRSSRTQTAEFQWRVCYSLAKANLT